MIKNIAFLKNITQKILSFCYDKKGSILIEFAFIAPILLIIFIGSVETTNYLGVNRRINSAAYTVTDLVGRFEVIDDTTMNNIWKAGEMIVSPVPFTEMSSVISSVKAVGGNYVVQWSRAKGQGTARAKGSSVPSSALGSNLIENGETLLLMDISYRYSPVLSQSLMDSFKVMTLSSHIVMKPRRVSEIPMCESPQTIDPLTQTCK